MSKLHGFKRFVLSGAIITLSTSFLIENTVIAANNCTGTISRSDNTGTLTCPGKPSKKILNNDAFFRALKAKRIAFSVTAKAFEIIGAAPFEIILNAIETDDTPTTREEEIIQSLAAKETQFTRVQKCAMIKKAKDDDEIGALYFTPDQYRTLDSYERLLRCETY